MTLAAEYREEAARCRAMAAKENDVKIKGRLLQIAREFDELAYRREHDSSRVAPQPRPIKRGEPR